MTTYGVQSSAMEFFPQFHYHVVVLNEEMSQKAQGLGGYWALA